MCFDGWKKGINSINVLLIIIFSSMQMSKESAHPTHPTPTPTVNERPLGKRSLNDEAGDFMSTLIETSSGETLHEQPSQPQNVDANNEAGDFMSILEETSSVETPVKQPSQPQSVDAKVSFETGSEIHVNPGEFITKLLEMNEQAAQKSNNLGANERSEVKVSFETGKRVFHEETEGATAPDSSNHTTPKIKYYTRIAVTAAEKPLTITFDDLDKL